MHYTYVTLEIGQENKRVELTARRTRTMLELFKRFGVDDYRAIKLRLDWDRKFFFRW